MCSYNKIHGVWACENPTTLGGHLKKDLKFEGWVMSDWGVTLKNYFNILLDKYLKKNFFFFF